MATLTRSKVLEYVDKYWNTRNPLFFGIDLDFASEKGFQRHRGQLLNWILNLMRFF